MQVDQTSITREICRRSYYKFFKRAWHVIEPNRPLVDNWHIKYLCDVAEYEVRRIAAGKIKEYDYIVNMPFRSLKSHIFSVFLQPWAWIDHPWLRFTNASYAGLSLNHSNKSQKIMGSDWYQKHFGHCFNLKSDLGSRSKLKETEHYFENDKGGYRFSSSVGGASTGYGGDINVADDLLKAQDAESEASRRKANEFYTETYPSRVSDFDKSVFFLIMQRLHADDPAGYMLQKQEESGEQIVFHINLPAEDVGTVKPKILRNNYSNGLFFPERFSRPVLKNIKIKIGLKEYSAQINQMPHRPGGELFKDHWFVKVPSHHMPKRKHYDKIVRYWDTAYTESEKNSATAYVEMGYIDGLVYILDYDFRWVEFPEQVTWIGEYSGLQKVEAKATGKAVAPVLRKKGLPVVAVEIEGSDKRTRANAISIHVEGGLIHVPEYHWSGFLNDTRQGILKYPEGPHDDLGDAFVLGVTDLLGKASHLDRDQLDKMIEDEPTHVYN